jgi:adenosylcobinamide-GDP ribazoletransferase
MKIEDVYRDFCAALSLLTRIPVDKFYHFGAAPDLSRAVYMYPVIGAGLGAIYALAYLGLQEFGLSGGASIIICIALSMLATGALHEDGLADLFDSFGGQNKTDKLNIMRDSRIGSYGALALWVGLTLRYVLLNESVSVENVFQVFILTEAVSRAPIALLANYFPYAAPDEKGVGASIAASAVPAKYVYPALAIGFAICALCVPLSSAVLLWAVAILSAMAVGAAAQRQIGGVTGDVYGASQQIALLATLSYNFA